MAYEKTIWEPREGSNLDRFDKANETDRSVILRNRPSLITKPGTKFSTQNMNKIEQGIYDAHELIAAEETERNAAFGLLAKADQVLEQSIKAETSARQQGDEALQLLVDKILALIPNQAGVSNLLADKNFVNSTVSNLAAWFLTPDSHGDFQWASLESLRTGPWYSGGTPKQPTQNDYAIFINQDPELGSVNSVWRALFSNELWSPQYKVNDTPFTADQIEVLSSKITAELVNKLTNPDNAPTQNSTELITSGGVFAWFGAAVVTLKTAAKNVVGAINELFENKIDKSEKGAVNGVATLDSAGQVPQSQIPSVPASINRTVTTNDNATGNVTDTGGNLSVPVPVTITAPAANSTQLAAGTASLRTRIQRLVDNIAHLFANKQNNLNRTVIASSTDATTAAVTDTSGNLTIPVSVTVAAATASSTLPGTGAMSLRNWLQAARGNIAHLQTNIENRAGFSTSSDSNQNDFPVGAHIVAGWSGGSVGRNAVFNNPRLDADGLRYMNTGTGSILTGAWRSCGHNGNGYYVLRKVSV